MDESQSPKEGWGVTPRGKVSEQLWMLWKKSRLTEPDDDAIANALDQTEPEDRNTQTWFSAAKARLKL
jgi:hypothetical protein